MEQEKLASLVKLILADPRIMSFIKKDMDESGDLTLIETKDIYDSLPLEWGGNVYCQELCHGDHSLLSYETVTQKEWKQVRVYQPSLNFIAKLALGMADEPILKLVQEMLMEGSDNISLVRLCNLSKIKRNSYQKLFLGYLEKIKDFGMKIEDSGFEIASDSSAVCTTKSEINLWQKKALTEKDLLGMENGITLTVNKKCIITSLATDMGRRKSIQICREGELR